MGYLQSGKVPTPDRSKKTHCRTCSLAGKLGGLFVAVVAFMAIQLAIILVNSDTQQKRWSVEASLLPRATRRRSDASIDRSNSSSATNREGPIEGRLLYVGVYSAPSHASIRMQLRSKYVSGVREAFAGSVCVEFIIGHTNTRVQEAGDSYASRRNYVQDPMSVEKDLWRESQEFGDIVRLPTPEAYENLPDKTLLLFERGVRAGYRFIMKLDEDRILNIMGILEYLKNLSDPRVLLYGGRSYHGKAVDSIQIGLQGTFAGYFSGPSYFLSWELARHIAKVQMSHSAAYLRYGCTSEDVNMGIWVEYVTNQVGTAATYQTVAIATDPSDTLVGYICLWEWRSLCLQTVSEKAFTKISVGRMCHYNFLDGGGISAADCQHLCEGRAGCNEFSIHSTYGCRYAKDGRGCCSDFRGANLSHYCNDNQGWNADGCSGGRCSFHSKAQLARPRSIGRHPQSHTNITQRLVALHTDHPTRFAAGPNGTFQLATAKGIGRDCLSVMQKTFKLGVSRCSSDEFNLTQFLFCEDLTLRLKSQPSMCLGVSRDSLTNGTALTMEPCELSRMQRFDLPSLGVSTVTCPRILFMNKNTASSAESASKRIHMQSTASTNKCLLYLGVLSFPLNVNRRNAVRKAYMQALRQREDTKAYFFIGHERFWEVGQGSVATPRQVELEKQLQHEIETYHDINRIPLVDVQSHLQDKLLMLFRQGVDLDCRYIAKVSDDRMIDVSILPHILREGCRQDLCYAGDGLRSHVLEDAADAGKIDYFSGVVILSRQLAWQITEVHMDRSAAFFVYGGKNMDLDIGWWVNWEVSQGGDVQYFDRVLGTTELATSADDRLEPEVLWTLRPLAHAHLCWAVADRRNGGLLTLARCGSGPAQNFALPPDGTIRPSHDPHRCLAAPGNELRRPDDVGVLFFKDCAPKGGMSDADAARQRFSFSESGIIGQRDNATFCIQMAYIYPGNDFGKVRFQQCAKRVSDGYERFIMQKS